MHYRLPNMAHRKLSLCPKNSPFGLPRNYHQGSSLNFYYGNPQWLITKFPHGSRIRKTIRPSDSHHSSHRTLLRLSTGPLNSAQTPVTVHHRPPTRLPKDPTITKPTNLYRQPSPGTPYSPSLDSLRTPSRSPPTTREPTPLYGVRGGCKGAHNYFRF